MEQDKQYAQMTQYTDENVSSELKRISIELTLYYYIQQQLLDIENHSKFLKSIESKAEDMLSVSIFQNKNSFAYRNIIKTSEAFQLQSQLHLKLGLNEPILELINYRFNDFIIFFFMLIIAYYMFHYERESSTYLLIRSTKLGRLHTIVSKLVMYLMALTIVYIVTYGSCLLINDYIYGHHLLNRSIQSIAELARGQYVLSLFQFIFIYTGLKWIYFMFISSVIAILFILVQNLGKIILILGAGIIFEYLSYSYIHPYSTIGLIKYVNIFYMIRTEQMLTYYQNTNVIGYPLPTLELNLAVMTLGIVMLNVLSSLIFISNYGNLTENTLSKITKLWNKLIPSTRAYSLFSHEAFKQFWSNKGYLILIVALLFCYFNIQKEPITLDNDDRAYLQYIEQYGGVLNDDKMLEIENEKNRLMDFSRQIQQVEQDYKNQQISTQQYIEQYRLLSLETTNISGFYKFYNQVMELDQLGKEVMVTNKLANNYMFDHKLRTSLSAIFLVIFIVLSVSSIITTDYKSNMILLQQSSRYGRLKLWIHKHLVAYCTVVYLFVIVNVPVYINIYNYYRGFHWTAPLQSIDIYYYTNWNLTVWQFLLLVHLAQLAAALLITEVILFLSYLLKRQALVIGCSGVLFVIPIIIGSFYIEQFQHFPINRILLLQLYISNHNYNLLHLAIILCIGVLFVGFSWLMISPLHRTKRRKFIGTNDSTSI